MRNKIAIWVSAAVFSCATATAFAQPQLWWIGGFNGRWDQATNWSPQNIPSASSAGVIDNSMAQIPLIITSNAGTWNYVYVGVTEATGMLTLRDGGRLVNIAGSAVGVFSGASGTVNVSGAGSRWETVLVDVGAYGTGQVNVQNGATAESLTSYRLAVQAGSVGRVVVDGAGSAFLSDNLIVGVRGRGELSATNGGSVSVNEFSAASSNERASASITVSGANSRVRSNTTATLANAGGSHCNVQIENGGYFGSGGLMRVGLFGATDINVAGTDSTLEGSMMVGAYTHSTVTLRDGATIRGNLQFSQFVEGSGTLSLGAQSDEAAGGPVTLDLGAITGGVTTSGVVFNHTGTVDLVNNAGNAIPINGRVRVTKLGSGTSILRHANSAYGGGTDVAGGFLRAVADGSLGSHTGIIDLHDGGTLMNQDSNLSLSSSREISLSNGQGSLRCGWSRTMYVPCPITGPGNLVISNDSGVVELGGASNSYGGDTYIGRDAANGGTGTLARLRLTANDVLPAATNIRFHTGTNGSATLDLNGTTQTARSILFMSGNATVFSVTPAQLTTTGPNPGGVGGALSLTGQSTLMLNQTLSSPTISVASQATLGGRAVLGAVTLLGGTLSPGNRIGSLSTAALVINAGSTIEWEVSDANLDEGVGRDLITASGITLNTSPTNPITIRLASLNPATGQPGPATNFDPRMPYTWRIMTTTGTLSGFNAARIAIDTTRFANAVAGDFSVWATGGHLFLLYTPLQFGDLDCNNVVNAQDVPLMVQALVDPAGYAAAHPACDIRHADMNQDGLVDGDDIALCVNCLMGNCP